MGPRPRAPSGPWDYRVCLPEAGRGLSWPSWGLRRGQRHKVGSAQPRAPQSWVHGTPAYKRFWGPGPSTPRRSGGSPRHGVLLALWPFMAPPAPPQPQVAETLMSEEAWGGLGPASQTHLGPCFLHVAFLQVVPGELWHQLGQKMGSGLGSLVTVPPHAPGPLPACSLPRSRNAPEERRGGCGALGQPPSPSRTRAAATHVGVAGPRERHLQVVEARGAECVEPVHDLLGAEEGVGPASALAACGGCREHRRGRAWRMGGEQAELGPAGSGWAGDKGVGAEVQASWPPGPDAALGVGQLFSSQMGLFLQTEYVAQSKAHLFLNPPRAAASHLQGKEDSAAPCEPNPIAGQGGPTAPTSPGCQAPPLQRPLPTGCWNLPQPWMRPSISFPCQLLAIASHRALHAR